MLVTPSLGEKILHPHLRHCSPIPNKIQNAQYLELAKLPEQVCQASSEEPAPAFSTSPLFTVELFVVEFRIYNYTTTSPSMILDMYLDH